MLSQLFLLLAVIAWGLGAGNASFHSIRWLELGFMFAGISFLV